MTAKDLDFPVEKAVSPSFEAFFVSEPEPEEYLVISIAEDDPILAKVKQLFADGFGGVILFGPPGTGKSWYARQIAASLGEASSRIRFVQFHPSYQYEDFVEAYVPNETGGFFVEDRHLLAMARLAAADRERTYVLVIDEMSRCDAIRVFGEALTYVETSLRDTEFVLSSGRQATLPSNLRIIATMNPWDRGVDDIDMALERRFAKVALEPDLDALKAMLSANGAPAEVIEAASEVFKAMLDTGAKYAQIGHAYFRSVKDRDGLRRLWEHQLLFHFRKSFELDRDLLTRVEVAWSGAISRLFPATSAQGASPAPQR